MQKILVTGNLGYIGQVLTRQLKLKGYKVRGIDVNYYSKGNLSFEIVVADEQIIKDIRKLNEKDVEGCDAVCHLAALSNDPLGELNTDLTYEINYEATIRLASICKKLRISRFLFSSTCSVYGISETKEIDENTQMNPLTAYAKTKILSEDKLREMADEHFCPVFLRNATVYGISPRFRIDLVLNNLVGWALTTRQIKILSDGTPWRPLVHVKDVSNAFITLLESQIDLIHCEAFNIGVENDNYQIKTLADMIHEQLQESEIVIKNEIILDAKSYNVSFKKMNTLFPSFVPQFTVIKGISELITHLINNGIQEEDMTNERFNRLKRITNLLKDNILNSQLYFN